MSDLLVKRVNDVFVLVVVFFGSLRDVRWCRLCGESSCRFCWRWERICYGAEIKRLLIGSYFEVEIVDGR